MRARNSPTVAGLEAELASSLGQLTSRQRAFVEAWWDAARYRVGRAAELAGYAWPEKQGSRLRTMPRVARAMALHQELCRPR